MLSDIFIAGWLRTPPDAMDSSLKADILKKIPKGISEMCVEATLARIHFKISANRYLDSF